jgi:uncharacterized membrane protein YkvA (DUF1232 family)
MPADRIPAFITGLGQTDDATMPFAAMQTLAPYFDETYFAHVKGSLDSNSPTG